MAFLLNVSGQQKNGKTTFLLVLICSLVNFTFAQKDPRMSSPIECARDCVRGAAPKICYYNFTLEPYSVLGLACKFCTSKPSNQFLGNCQCVTADGIEKMIHTTNRMIPGPSIQVCQHDKVVIDVKNTIPGVEATIHWHGIKQNGSQYYDGVPMVTQCAIPQGSTFRYQWIAKDDGTHYWHSHSGLNRMNGLYGSIIVRQPKSVDIHGGLYDYDLTDHVIIISDLFHQLTEDKYPGTLKNSPGQTAENLLINGKGIYIDPKKKNETNTPVEIFPVEPGKRYRLRLINAMASVCASILTIEGHKLQLIATDGDPVDPVKIDSIISVAGERYDFILNASQKIKSYWIHVRGLEECEQTQAQQFAILQYKGSEISSTSKRPSFKKHLNEGVVLNDYVKPCEKGKTVCISQLNSAKKLEKQLLPSEKPDFQLYMPFKIFPFKPEELFLPNQPRLKYLIAPISKPFGSWVEGIIYEEASSPLISQYNDIDPNEICNVTKKPLRCTPERCQCTNVRDIPLNSLVEIILVDEAPKSNQPKLIHPFHLHGYSFNVLAMGNKRDINSTHISCDVVKKADAEGHIVRRFNNPPLKDTIAMPERGFAVLRFRADNPGFWLFHCHFQLHMTIGMASVLHVGQESDLPPIPEGFPKCGNFKPHVTADMSKVV